MAAGDTQHHDIAFPDIDADGDTREVTYEVDLLLAEATAWAPAGYELAFGQLTGTLNPEQDITETSHDDDGRATRTLSRWNAGIRRDDEEILLSRTQEASSPGSATTGKWSSVAPNSSRSAH